MKAKNEVDMTTGKMLGKILFFAIPLMLSGILQLFYNAVNIVVVGRFSGSQYLAAVGSTSSLNSLIVNFFLGLSVGSSVIAARYFGSKDFKGFSRVMHTSIVISVLSGIVVGIV
ncbi:MAG: MATE family efflux transporter, partial [Bacillota bacterium]|nr:MATE family efflux transporter [Bacillota bacterium]